MHLRHFDSKNLNAITPLLPPQMDHEHEYFLKTIFNKMHSFEPDLKGAELRQAILKHFGPLLAYTSSDLFTDFEDIDLIDTTVAKGVIYIDLFRYITVYKYKFVERMIGLFEGAICIPALIGHPFQGLMFTQNIVAYGRDNWLKRSAKHLNLHKRTKRRKTRRHCPQPKRLDAPQTEKCKVSDLKKTLR
eukprot:964536_1